MDYMKIRELRYRIRRVNDMLMGGNTDEAKAIRTIASVVDEILLELEAPQHDHTPEEVGL